MPSVRVTIVYSSSLETCKIFSRIRYFNKVMFLYIVVELHLRTKTLI